VGTTSKAKGKRYGGFGINTALGEGTLNELGGVAAEALLVSRDKLHILYESLEGLDTGGGFTVHGECPVQTFDEDLHGIIPYSLYG
jgi:hypothetical protein